MPHVTEMRVQVLREAQPHFPLALHILLGREPVHGAPKLGHLLHLGKLDLSFTLRNGWQGMDDRHNCVVRWYESTERRQGILRVAFVSRILSL
jgi:hypothetical protein